LDEKVYWSISKIVAEKVNEMKKAIIIGASTGIGRALTKILVREGYEVGLVARNQEMLLPYKRKSTLRAMYFS